LIETTFSKPPSRELPSFFSKVNVTGQRTAFEFVNYDVTVVELTYATEPDL
jgi:hypothetical protein